MLRLCVVSLLWFSGISAYGLEWRQKEITLESALGARAADAVFDFDNKGTEPVTIITITTSCACTTATADKMTYEINDSGKISVHFDFEGRTGKQQRTILVLAWENGEQTVAKLTLNVTIKVLSETRPSQARWKIDEARLRQIPAWLYVDRSPVGNGVIGVIQWFQRVDTEPHAAHKKSCRMASANG